MTDRLAEFDSRQYQHQSVSVDDIESGRDGETEKELSKFNREADAIEKVYVWASNSIETVKNAMSDPDALPTVNSQLDAIEKKLDNVRVRLQRISKENKEMASAKEAKPATMRIRISRTTTLANDFMTTTSSLEKVREKHKSLATNAVKRDIMRANPHVSESQVDEALDNPDSNQLDVIIQQGETAVSNAQLRNQVEDLRLRNRDIQNLSKNIVQLHQMFQDMSILVNGQQDLINEIEQNVVTVKTDVKKAGEELEVALQHQRSARKKKICICVLITVIIAAIVGGIIIYMCLQPGRCSASGGSGNSSSSSDPAPPPASTAPPTAGPTSTPGEAPEATDSGAVNARRTLQSSGIDNSRRSDNYFIKYD